MTADRLASTRPFN